MQENGLFETMLMEKSEIHLKELHFDRLFRGMKLLGIETARSKETLEEEIRLDCAKNDCSGLARIRLSVYKGPKYRIETAPLDPAIRNPKKGLVVGIYPHGIKTIDTFSNLKSTNYSLYLNAAHYAKENGLDDCLLLNSKGNVCESSISNVFIIKNKRIVTPSLTEGCIEGVMRKWLIATLKQNGHSVNETSINLKEVETADEVFLTNAVRGIRWVKLFKENHYSNSFSSTIAK